MITGNEVDKNLERRDHGGTSLGFCSPACVTRWDAMTPDERADHLGDN